MNRKVSLAELLDRQDGGDLLVLANIDQVDDRLALGGAAPLGNLVDLEPVHAAGVGEAEQVVLGRGDEELFDEILFLGLHAGLALAAAPLGAVEVHGAALDVAGVGDGDHHLLVLDGVLQGDVGGLVDDLGAALVAELVADLGQFRHDDLEDLGVGSQDLPQPGDELQDLFVLGDDLVPLQAGQALQAHLQDGLGLDLGQLHRPLVAGRPGQIEAFQVFRIGKPPLHQPLLGLGRGLGLADQLDDRIQPVQGDLEAFQDMGPGHGLLQLEVGAAGDHLAAVIDEAVHHLAQGQTRGRLWTMASMMMPKEVCNWVCL